ncbi:hypothetical protein GIB67_033299 [Kingdonia uniflora]|uniref:Hexosyltransferase n=1 Tax=Kingdonia uniflora TaxID=39325 RepID=A0A7J7M9T6_9MAGN|nr:hypothetical protein GIB67_033299 [Kingdonia uniflora]
MKAMEGTLNKASQIYTDCPAMATKLRAMTYNAEEQVQAHKNQATYLVQLASRTTPKGLHCLSMRLTADYFARLPEEQELPNKQKLHDPDIYHFAVFSDNILACAVEPKKIVFHIVTDALNLPAMKMWFLSNPPGHAAIEIESIDDFKWISEKYSTKLTETDARDPRYSSALNHLRFYLPEGLKGLWKVNLKGKVNGAVETCKEGDSSFHRMDMFINFSDPMVAKNFDSNACTWAFGMNVFDLREWRRKNLTAVYRKYLKLGKKQQLWKGGSLPLGLVTFYNQTVGLDQRWHVSGLGYDSGVLRADIDRAAVIHYDGNMKPWLEIGIGSKKMATIAASSVAHACILQKGAIRASSSSSPILGLPAMARRGRVTCSTTEKSSSAVSNFNFGASLTAAATAAMTMASPALAIVDERLSTEGTGLPLGLSTNSLGWILFVVFGLIWANYFIYTSGLDEDEESGLSL